MHGFMQKALLRIILIKMATLQGILHRIKKLFIRDADPDRYLRFVSGVIHVGANTGQERECYKDFGLRVLWVEPIPRVYEELEANLIAFPKQRAVQALVTDKDNETYEFHIANNNGESSSIFELKEHKDIWPGVVYEETISLQSKTLTSLLQDENIDPSSFDALVMDTQGSELLVLKGGWPILKNFHYVKTEVADFESYAGCCRLEDLDQFMRTHGFREFSRHAFAHRDGGGTYYDITYKRNS
jgi:FkbM family methyltransferase